MRKTTTSLVIFLLAVFPLAAQLLYVSDNDEKLYRLNMEQCSYEFIVQMQIGGIFDITFHPNGKLYAVSWSSLYEVDTLTGGVSFVTDFGTTCSALTASGDGVIYAAASNGQLWSYNPIGNQTTFHGNIGYPAAGDLTFFDGNLYLAATDDRIVLVNIANPANSEVVIDANVPGNILGIVSYGQSCSNLNAYAITNNDSQILQIDFDNGELDFVCQLDIEVYGGASTYEFFAFSQVEVSDVSTVPSCDNDEGLIQVFASGGIGQLEYSYNGVDFQLSNTFFGMPSGVYTMAVRDEIGCVVEEETEIATLDSPEIESFSTTLPSCGNNNGVIEVNLNGGTGTVLYSILGSNLQTSPVFQNLAPGVYNITVQDSLGCEASSTLTLAAQPPPQITGISTLPSCGPDNGMATITAVNGLTPYQFSLDGNIYQSSNVFSGLEPGDYDFVLMDASGCIAEGDFTITPSPGISVSGLQVAPTSCGEANGILVVFAGGGTGDLEFSLDGVDYQSSTQFNGLAGGAYTLTVQDELGCTVQQSVQIPASTAPAVEVVEAIPATCDEANGILEVQASLGTGPYSFSLNGSSFQEVGLFEDLNAATYQVTVQDAAGCTGTANVLIEDHGPPDVLSIDVIEPTCGNANGQINIDAEGIGPLQYAINESGFQPSNEFANLPTGTYSVMVLDANECLVEKTVIVLETISAPPTAIDMGTDTTVCPNDGFVLDATNPEATSYEWQNGGTVQALQVTEPGTYSVTWENVCGSTTSEEVTIGFIDCSCVIEKPSAFTPDGDGNNETFRILYQYCPLDDFHLYVFDRWGRIVFESLDPDQGWNGTDKGKDVPSDVYLWRMTYRQDGQFFQEHGELTLIR